MKEENDFLVKTEGHCFFCLTNIQAPVSPFEAEMGFPITSKLPIPPICSLQYFSRYLKMDMTRVFSTNEPISSKLLAKVEKAKLKVELCEECASQTGRFSNLCRQLEKIETEIEFYVKLIRGKVMNSDISQLSRLTEPGFSNKFMGKLEIVNALRDEAVNKCTAKLDDTITPQVKLQNHTKRQLHLKRLKLKGRSRSSFLTHTEKKYLLTPHPVDSTKPKLEQSCSPPIMFSSHDEGDNEFYPDECSNSDQDVDLKTAIVLPSTIPKTVATPRGKLNPETGKYKCESCSKEFTESGKVTRHYRSVHLKIKYRCSLCSKEFTTSDNHRRHVRIEHLGVRFKCKFCSETFKEKTILQSHFRRTACGKELSNPLQPT